MENILLPSKMTFSEGSKENESILTIEPLHHGYGTTMGNVLRRVLLSSLEGAAVTAVKVKGAQHEFSAVPGVKEDVLEVILNLKQIRMRVHSDEPIVLSLNISGKEGPITASEISANADVEIINGDFVIANATSKSESIEMEITVARGRGFNPTEKREASGEIGLMAVDAMFSPIIGVGIKVENTRVGEITNYDKLTLTIQGDGTMTAEEAVANATNIVLNHFNWIEGQLENATLTERLNNANTETTTEVEESDDSEESEDEE